MKDMDVNWIKEQMAISGATQRDIAGAIGLNDSKMSSVMSGRRQLKSYEADKIRRYFGFNLPEDMPSTIAVVGKVGAGDHIELSDDYEKGAGLYHIARPQWLPANNVVAAQIDGASAEPWALDGDIIFWRREAVMVMPEDLGRPVVAQLMDGRVLLKRLASGSKSGTWSLLSINPTHPNLIDVEVKWASRVLPPLSREEVTVIES